MRRLVLIISLSFIALFSMNAKNLCSRHYQRMYRYAFDFIMNDIEKNQSFWTYPEIDDKPFVVYPWFVERGEFVWVFYPFNPMDPYFDSASKEPPFCPYNSIGFDKFRSKIRINEKSRFIVGFTRCKEDEFFAEVSFVDRDWLKSGKNWGSLHWFNETKVYRFIIDKRGNLKTVEFHTCFYN